MTVKTTEAAVLRACLDLLTLRRIPHWRQNTGAARLGARLVRFGIPGGADILGLIPYGGSGRFLAVEVKRPGGGRTTDAQVAFLAAVRRAGGVAVVISDVAELGRLLDRLEADPGADLAG